MPSYDRALWALRTWLDSWSGIGHVAVGMHRSMAGTFNSPSTATGTGARAEPQLESAACASTSSFPPRGVVMRSARHPR
jgi:hypothetical protein